MADDVKLKRCSVCQATEKLKICSNCSQQWYCGREHQNADWLSHKPLCEKIRQMKLKEQEIVEDMSKCNLGKRNNNHVVKPGSPVVNSKQSSGSDIQQISCSLSENIPTQFTDKWFDEKANIVSQCLRIYGLAVMNKFLGAELGNKILEEAKSLHDRQLMTDGRTVEVRAPDHGTRSTARFRSDIISWVGDSEPEYPGIGTMMRLIDGIMQRIQPKFMEYEIRDRTKAMVACYPGGGSQYVKHVDNPLKDGRLLTCIYYLNKDWDCEKHGGMLKIYPTNNKNVACIEPVMDRLIIFWSDRRNPHEVLPSHQPRYAVTTWYFDAAERKEAQRRKVEELTRSQQLSRNPASSQSVVADDSILTISQSEIDAVSGSSQSNAGSKLSNQSEVRSNAS